MVENTSASMCSSIIQPLSATSAKQYIRSPNYPLQYPKDKTCVWGITATSDSYIIKIEFLAFDLQYSFDCSSAYDSLEIRDGSSNSSSLIKIICQSNKPKLKTGIYSSGKYLYLKFKSDNFQSLLIDKGFVIRYSSVLKVTSCSSIHSNDQNSNIMLSGSSGIVKSPNFPLNYPKSIKCIWRIKLSNNTDIVKISFTSFEVESNFTSDCSQLYDDYLEIFDGYNVVNGVSLGRFCGTKVPPNIYTRKNMLTIVFNSESYTTRIETRKGFSAAYSSFSSSDVRGSCVTPNLKNIIYLSNSAGVITSPSYPAKYPIDMDCTWRINVSSGKRVKLYFLGTFQLQRTCHLNFVEIRDGLKTNGKSLGKFCDIVKPPVIVSSSNSATVQFQSDNRTPYAGFYLVYEETNEKNVQYLGYCSPYLSSVQTFKLTNTSGTIMSPNYPNNYPRNIQCVWKISVRDGKRVKFVMEDMKMEKTNDCIHNFIEVRDGYHYYSDVLQTYCGYSYSAEPAIYSTDRYMWIMFISLSNPSFYSKGFKAQFSEFDKSVCLSIKHPLSTTTANQSLLSPNYPLQYPTGKTCVWGITAPSDSYVIKIEFLAFDLQSYGNCSSAYDSLEIRDGSSNSSSLIELYCQKNKPKLRTGIYSSGRYLYLKFKSDRFQNYFTNRGFLIRYSAVFKKV